ncbi:hypothetical protein EV126DRAFT_412457 [Verticillium dahliae]|uniref:Uncharacterized protein n=1 Tax=Verticillium dahliae TaxID=27337 RepID=A0AA45AGX1_VERDA|nr:hypothetical protein EV126DRAFT_412457 [Verticillium dahliae]PNH26465.1 hypothetical protein BJF96_g10225 [Verticillium dahliae]
MRSVVIGVVALAAAFARVQAQSGCSSALSSETGSHDKSSRTALPSPTSSCSCLDRPTADPSAQSSSMVLGSDKAISSKDWTVSSSIIPHSTSTTPVASTTHSRQPSTPSNPPAGSVRVEFMLEDTRHREDIQVKNSGAQPKKVRFMACNGRVVSNNGLGLVQCNVEINHDYFNYESVPAFTSHFPVSFDRPQNVTGVKCYKI